jgi:hypothetical protein
MLFPDDRVQNGLRRVERKNTNTFPGKIKQPRRREQLWVRSNFVQNVKKVWEFTKHFLFGTGCCQKKKTQMSVVDAMKFFNTRAQVPVEDMDCISYTRINDNGILYHRMTLSKTGSYCDTMRELIFVAPKSSKSVADLVSVTPQSCRILKYL